MSLEPAREVNLLDPMILPLDIIREICQYLALHQIHQARYVSHCWFDTIISIGYPSSFITQWYQQNVPELKPLKVNSAINQIIAFEKGIRVKEKVIKGQFDHITYADDVLAGRHTQQIEKGVFSQLRHGRRGEITSPDGTAFSFIAVSGSMIVTIVYSQACYVWELTSEGIASETAERVEHSAISVDQLLVSEKMLAIVDMAHAKSTTVTTFNFVTKVRTLFTIPWIHRCQGKFMFDDSGQSMICFQHIIEDSGDHKAGDVHCARYDLKGKLQSQDSKFCPFDRSSFQFWNDESVVRTRCSTLWTSLRRQSEDPAADNTIWILHRICYDNDTERLEIKRQIIHGLRTTRDGVVNLLYWKHLVYCRSYSFQSSEGEKDHSKQSELSIINLKTSWCQRANSPMGDPWDSMDRDNVLISAHLEGDETYLIEDWMDRIVVWGIPCPTECQELEQSSPHSVSQELLDY